LRRTYHRLINHFGRSRWYSYVTWVKWKLISVHWEIVLNLAQGRCMVCAEHTIGLEIILAHPMVLQGEWVKWKLISVLSEILLISAQDRHIVCAKCTLVMKTISGTPYGIHR
jgi:hypothetical protein